MPQGNPTAATASKGESISIDLQGASFVPATGVNFKLQFEVTIPPPFTSMELVHHIRSGDSGGTLQLYFQARLTPTSISNISNAPIFFPTLVGGGSAYPLICKSGFGPAFQYVAPISPGADIIGQADYNQPYVGGNANSFQPNLVLSVPMTFTYILASAAFPLQPSLDGDLTYTFYR